MCLISFALGFHDRYRLVLIAHRDEFFQRPSTPMHWWKSDAALRGRPRILAGQDEVGGGTWLGLNENGRWAAVTNFREQHPEREMRTRGELVASFLASDQSPADYLSGVYDKSTHYNGFNLLVGNLDEVIWFSNRASGSNTLMDPLSNGIYGLSNHLLDTPWPKVELAKNCLAEKLESELVSSDQLVTALQSETRPADELLPSTGVDLATERMLSSMFINDSVRQYGTRCATALTISVEGKVEIVELTYPERSSVKYSFTVD